MRALRFPKVILTLSTLPVCLNASIKTLCYFNSSYHCVVTGLGNSVEGSPSSAATTSTQRSPNINLGLEYSLTVHTTSYNEMWARIHVPAEILEVEVENVNGDDDGSRVGRRQQLHLSQVLQPNRECVEQALQHAKPNTITRLVSKYFEHSEDTTNLCLRLHQCILLARALYAPLIELLDDLPIEYECITQSDCDRALEVFSQFDRAENPFPCTDSHNNFQEMRRSFSELKQQLHVRLKKSESRIRLFRQATTGTALCVVGTAAAVTVAAAVVATHALIAIIAAPLCTAYLPRDLTKKELARVAQLDAAAKGTFVLDKNLDTIDRLVAKLYIDIEEDKQWVRLALERGNDRFCIREVLRQLRKTREKFTTQLASLEEHLCIGFNIVNRARSSLLDEIRTLTTECN